MVNLMDTTITMVITTLNGVNICSIYKHMYIYIFIWFCTHGHDGNNMDMEIVRLIYIYALYINIWLMCYIHG